MYGYSYINWLITVINYRGYGKARGKSRLIREDEYDKSDEEEDGGGEGEGRLMNFGTTNEPTRQLQVRGCGQVV